MAKTQKTFYLNGELTRLIAAISDTTGASFTKIVTAALIQNLLGDMSPPDSRWMRLAEALERGECSLPDLLSRIAEHKLLDAEKRLQEARERQWNEAITNTHLAWSDEQNGITVGYVRALLRPIVGADDPMSALVTTWTNMVSHQPNEPRADDYTETEA